MRQQDTAVGDALPARESTGEAAVPQGAAPGPPAAGAARPSPPPARSPPLPSPSPAHSPPLSSPPPARSPGWSPRLFECALSYLLITSAPVPPGRTTHPAFQNLRLGHCVHAAGSAGAEVRPGQPAGGRVPLHSPPQEDAQQHPSSCPQPPAPRSFHASATCV